MKTITVRELIALLEDEDEDAKVIFATDYGDRCHTEQALPLRGDIEEVLIEKSAYSNSGYAVAEDPDEADGKDADVYLVIR